MSILFDNPRDKETMHMIRIGELENILDGRISGLDTNSNRLAYLAYLIEMKIRKKFQEYLVEIVDASDIGNYIAIDDFTVDDVKLAKEKGAEKYTVLVIRFDEFLGIYHFEYEYCLQYRCSFKISNRLSLLKKRVVYVLDKILNSKVTIENIRELSK